ncbi:N-acyl homoserine lactone hydrolase [Metapseudomonas resinovorans]|uniref:N-acyl homoserine lactonase family protein n=1 Tax=Metapseudomonas resinovorans TaxID=53412 RepID=UPI00237EF7D2|nr:N-acyl homoserine lactonase family protein [Pseudomonas resinovorans]MDE3736737.1 N-acyl homoserine lactonase family protein [Pseudomonas resinovorans]
MEELKLYAMTCGWITMPYGFFMAGESGNLAVPIPCYLIEHPKGTALFDTGLELPLQSTDPAIVKDALGIFSDLTTVKFLPGEDISKRLEALGIDPAKINFIINSHLHFDHCGGNACIPNAQLVVQKREWQAAGDDENIEKQIYSPRHYDLGHDRLEIDGEHDLFGDGSVVLIPSYGHTPGHQSLKVKIEGKEILITADACYLKASLERMTLPDAMVVNDAEAMLNNFRLFKRLEAKGAFVIYGHDPKQSRLLTEGPARRVTTQDLAVL